MNQNVFIYERKFNQFLKKTSKLINCFSLLYVFLDIEDVFFSCCQMNKTPLRHMRSYSFIQLGIVAFVKMCGSSQYEKFGKVNFLVLKHANK
jgi:hypothetical protein